MGHNHPTIGSTNTCSVVYCPTHTAKMQYLLLTLVVGVASGIPQLSNSNYTTDNHNKTSTVNYWNPFNYISEAVKAKSSLSARGMTRKVQSRDFQSTSHCWESSWTSRKLHSMPETLNTIPSGLPPSL